ncbi:Terpene cyclase [Mycena venus]|uniref:Terpene synthase n=1 Tax=Mycena venus TaxID=2733690 RepID=A0A8H6XDI6_9AGAR|nr:Terpene cyclase [Mycena venus]
MFIPTSSDAPVMIYLPETMSRWPWLRALNPHYEEVSAASKAWLHSLRPFNLKSQYAFDKGDFGRLAALGYPNASKEHLRIGCDLMNVFFVIDEYTDVESASAVRDMVDIIIDVLHNPHKPRAEGEMVLGEIVRQFWERTLKSASPSAAKHFVESFTDYLESVAEQAKERESDTPLTLDDYVAMRKRNIGASPSLMPAELQLNLSDDVFYHHTVQRLRECAAELIFLDNDMVSYNKEQAAGDTCHNILAIAMRQLEIDLPAAMKWLHDYHLQVEAKFFEALRDLPSFGPEVDHQLGQYLYAIAIWPRGADCWNFEGGRYFGSKGLEIQKTRCVPMLPKVDVDSTLKRENVRVLLVEL